MKKYNRLTEKQNDIRIGDEILIGKFKNKTAIVKGFGTDKNNQPVIYTNKGTISLYHCRIKKLMSEDMEKYQRLDEERLDDLQKEIIKNIDVVNDSIKVKKGSSSYGNWLSFYGIVTFESKIMLPTIQKYVIDYELQDEVDLSNKAEVYKFFEEFFSGMDDVLREVLKNTDKFSNGKSYEKIESCIVLVKTLKIIKIDSKQVELSIDAKIEGEDINVY